MKKDQMQRPLDCFHTIKYAKIEHLDTNNAIIEILKDLLLVFDQELSADSSDVDFEKNIFLLVYVYMINYYVVINITHINKRLSFYGVSCKKFHFLCISFFFFF